MRSEEGGDLPAGTSVSVDVFTLRQDDDEDVAIIEELQEVLITH